MKKRIASIFAIMATLTMMCMAQPDIQEEVATTVTVEMSDVISSPNDISVEPQILYEEPGISDEEINLLALVTMAEAEGESKYGKRLVIDTILNRVDHERFPDTITDVIYQPSQFSSMWNGRVDRCHVSDEIVQLVKEELESRTNYDVIFFTANKYGKYGTPMFQEGNHYFASY